MSTTGSLQYNYIEVHNEQTSMAMQVHTGTDPVMNQGGWSDWLRFQDGSKRITIATGFKLRCCLLMSKAYSACSCYRGWGKSPRKTLKVCSPETESENSFD